MGSNTALLIGAGTRGRWIPVQTSQSNPGMLQTGMETILMAEDLNFRTRLLKFGHFYIR